MKSRRHPVRRRRETSPREGTGMGRLSRESSRRRPHPHGGVGRRRGRLLHSPYALAKKATGLPHAHSPAATTTLHSCRTNQSENRAVNSATTVALKGGSYLCADEWPSSSAVAVTTRVGWSGIARRTRRRPWRFAGVGWTRTTRVGSHLLGQL